MEITAAKTVQNQTTAPKLNIDFKHRLAAFGDEATLLNLVDIIQTMARQATNTLELVSQQFTDAEVDKVSDEIVFWTIDTAINTIHDMQSIVSAFHEAEKAKEGV